jgi:hypothetical protein
VWLSVGVRVAVVMTVSLSGGQAAESVAGLCAWW